MMSRKALYDSLRFVALWLILLVPPVVEAKPNNFAKERIPAVEAFPGGVDNNALRFEENNGQTDRQVKYFARGHGYQVFLTPSEAIFSFRNVRSKRPAIDSEAKQRQSAPALGMSFANANPGVVLEGLEEQRSRSAYVLARDPTGRLELANFAAVKYHELYRGVDLIYHSTKSGQLEYDFVVTGGHDYRCIQVKLAQRSSGSPVRFRLDTGGALIAEEASREIARWERPIAYQHIGGHRREVQSKFVLTGNDCVEFEVGTYDKSQTLVIDPVLTYSSYLGGSDSDEAAAVAVDPAGNCWVTGYTSSLNFPVVASTVQSSKKLTDNSLDLFVSKFNSSGKLELSTYIGGSQDDVGTAIAIGPNGDVLLTGYTTSTDFPTTASALQRASAGLEDAFFIRLNSSGSLIYSTLLGGSDLDAGYGIAADGNNNVWITGATASPNFPGAGTPVQKTYGGGALNTNTNRYPTDVFVAKFAPTGALAYSTYLGGSQDDYGAAVAVDSAGGAWVTGSAKSLVFPITATAAGSRLAGSSDAFVTHLTASGALLYSRFLGGVNPDRGNALAVDGAQNIWVAGGTGSPDFPVTQGAYRATYPGLQDAFVLKLNSAGDILYSTYLGGRDTDEAFGIALDASGAPWIVGMTSSGDFPITPAASQSTFGGGSSEAFATKLTAAGALEYSTFIGGSADEFGSGIAVDKSARVWVAGFTTSGDLPVSAAAFQKSGGGTSLDGFVAQFDQSGSPNPGQSLLNISTRLRVNSGSDVLIGGFIITGTKPKRVVVRALGPSLSTNGAPVAGALQDPVLELHDSGGVIISSNDNWVDSPQKQAIIDTTIPPPNSRESAIVASLNPGAFTAVVRGTGNTAGVALVELFDIDSASPARVVNISTRGRVETGDNVMIAGFILGGSNATKVLVRGIGPSLGKINPPVNDALADPQLELRDSQGNLMASNDNWQESMQAQQISDTTIPPSDAKEPAIVAGLTPGAYTAILRGANGGTGIGLVEVYKLN